MDTSIIINRLENLESSTDLIIPKNASVDVFAELSLTGTRTIIVQIKSGDNVLISDDLAKGAIAVLNRINSTCTSLVLHNQGYSTARVNITLLG